MLSLARRCDLLVCMRPQPHCASQDSEHRRHFLRFPRQIRPDQSQGQNGSRRWVMEAPGHVPRPCLIQQHPYRGLTCEEEPSVDVPSSILIHGWGGGARACFLRCLQLSLEDASLLRPDWSPSPTLQNPHPGCWETKHYFMMFLEGRRAPQAF